MRGCGCDVTLLCKDLRSGSGAQSISWKAAAHQVLQRRVDLERFALQLLLPVRLLGLCAQSSSKLQH